MRAVKRGAGAAAAVLAMLAAGCASSTPEPAGSSTTSAASTTSASSAATDREARSQAILDAAVAADIPGCSAAVGQEGQVVWTGVAGLADLTTKAPITPDTSFDIASVSKQFTAASVLMLAQEGKVVLTEPMSTYVTGFPAWADTVTVTDLIHHRTGIPGYIELFDAQGLDRNDPVSQQLVMDTLRAITTLKTAPGTVFDYSDSNYVVLAEIVRAVAGVDLPTFLQDRIFTPLGLGMVLDPVGPVANGAVPYETWEGAIRDTRDTWEEYGATAVQATPSDLVRWADNYRTGAIGGPELVRAMTEDDLVPMQGSVSYGGGLFVDTTTGGIGHPGGWLGFSTHFAVSPDRMTASAVSCNFAATDIGEVSGAIADIWIRGM